MKIQILYEDKDVLVINKPSGILVHGNGRENPLNPPCHGDVAPSLTREGRGGFERTITDWILKHYPKLKNVGEPMKLSAGSYQLSAIPRFTSSVIERPGIVHRLDKETSGVLIIAKNQKTFEFLKKQFKNREVKKVYQAIVWGHVKKEQGIINVSIGRSAKFGKFIASRGKRGKIREAITEYKVLKRLTLPLPPSLIKAGGTSPDKGRSEGLYSLLEIYPKTGRTHQIRVHLKYINHPIVCDKLYAPNKPCPILLPLRRGRTGGGLSRLALHAASIEFTLLSGKKIKVEAPLPVDFQLASSNKL